MRSHHQLQLLEILSSLRGKVIHNIHHRLRKLYHLLLGLLQLLHPHHVALIPDNKQLLAPASHPHIDCVKTEEFAVGRILITLSKLIT